MTDRGEPYIRAISGRRIYVRDPDLNPQIHLSDLAYGLARINRFTGHTRHRYSVASHCLMVADLVPPSNAWRASGLLHDAIEAILGDVSSPLKSLLPEYKALQSRWETALAKRWGFLLDAEAIKKADRLAYAIERRDLCPYVDGPQGWDIESTIEIPPNAPRCAKYAGRPAAVMGWWLTEARRCGVREIA